MAANSSQSLLKILCLHGYRQNDKSFRERTGAFRKILKKHAELVFISAPNRIPPTEPLESQKEDDGEDQRGWWFSASDSTYCAQDYTDCVKGYQESLDVIMKAFEDQGPFDGVLGFSQGASMLSLICGLKEQMIENFQFDFAIFVAGFKSRQKPHTDLYNRIITIPSLHVFGDTDKVIEKEMSEHLLQYFKDPKILQHKGGHFIPASGPQKNGYLEFLDNMISKKLEKNMNLR